MKLFIDSSKYTAGFSLYLLQKIKEKLFVRLRIAKLFSYEEYIYQTNMFESTSGKRIRMKLYPIVLRYISGIRMKKIKNYYLIETNDSMKVPNFKVKVSTVCRFLNNGNTDIQGYPLFTEVFSFIENNLEDCYKVYLSKYMR